MDVLRKNLMTGLVGLALAVGGSASFVKAVSNFRDADAQAQTIFEQYPGLKETGVKLVTEKRDQGDYYLVGGLCGFMVGASTGAVGFSRYNQQRRFIKGGRGK
jgi:hypothetical protein